MKQAQKQSEAVDLLAVMFDICLKRKTAVLDRMGVTEKEYNFFMSLEKCSNLNIMQIANQMKLAQAKVSRMTDKFIKKGYIKRETQKNDHRSVKIVFTEEGVKMFKYAIDNKCMGEERIKSILKEDKYEEFKRLLRQLVEEYAKEF